MPHNEDELNQSMESTNEPTNENVSPPLMESPVETTETPAWQTNRLDLSKVQSAADTIKAELKKVIIGQENLMDQMLIGLFTGGHVLLEGVPGIAKTLTANLLAKTLQTDFSRIQFTPDLMPTDVVGTNVYNLQNSEFTFNAGPVFSNIILIDEINRAPAKTQAALFEVMEEFQVTISKFGRRTCYIRSISQ